MNKLLFVIFFNLLFTQYAPYFDGEAAFEHLMKQCSFGPRFPGSQAHLEFKDFLVDFLKKNNNHVEVYEHEIDHPYDSTKVFLYNVLSQYNLEAKNRILLMAHWDTREIADLDQDQTKRNKPIVGANDGASGVAALMLFAEIFKKNKLQNIGVDLLFVDGEDMGRHGELENFCLGSKLFANNKNYIPPQLAICLDMVADKDPQFKMEYFSYIQAKEELFDIWNLANSIGYSEFSYDLTGPIYDDHKAYYDITKIPSIDIIDFDYPYWHTLDDTPDKCSPTTLKIVGDVVLEYIYRLDFNE